MSIFRTLTTTQITILIDNGMSEETLDVILKDIMETLRFNHHITEYPFYTRKIRRWL